MVDEGKSWFYQGAVYSDRTDYQNIPWKKTGLKIWAGVALAVVGMYFLCITKGFAIGKGDLLGGFFVTYPGNRLFFASY